MMTVGQGCWCPDLCTRSVTIHGKQGFAGRDSVKGSGCGRLSESPGSTTQCHRKCPLWGGSRARREGDQAVEPPEPPRGLASHPSWFGCLGFTLRGSRPRPPVFHICSISPQLTGLPSHGSSVLLSCSEELGSVGGGDVLSWDGVAGQAVLKRLRGPQEGSGGEGARRNLRVPALGNPGAGPESWLHARC